MGRFPINITCFALLLALSPATSSAQAHFTARLDGAQETPSVATAARGTVAATLTKAGQLRLFITVEGLSGPAIAAHIHDGAPGAAGPVVRSFLAEFAGTNSAAVNWTPAEGSPLTPALVAKLMAGNLYVDVHTAANVSGEIRGQLRLSAGAHLTATLQGKQENPSLEATGTGTGSFTLTEEGLHYKITATGLTGAITGARIYTGAIGVNGAVTFDIAPSFTGNSATGLITGLTSAQRKDLLAGNMYVNVLTAANPTGETRGQIGLAGGIGLFGAMDASQEVPPTGSAGRGTLSATLTPLGLIMSFSANGLSGAITGVSLRNAASGAIGPVVRSIVAGEFLSAATGLVLWRYDDAQPLTPTLVSELLQGNLYVNLTTAANPGGEIRAQLSPMLPTATATASFTANITGAQEEPSVAGAALGTGNFVLMPIGLAFRVTVEGLTGAITIAHFHSAAIGVNGPVVRAVAAGEFVSPTTMAGMWTPADATPLTAALISELMKGNLYFNVHTGANPGGEMRGQILPASGAEFEARLTGAQETPATGAAALGAGSFTLTPQGLRFNLTFDGLTGTITAAHIHSGAPGVAGPVVRSLTEFVTTNTLAGVWKPTDTSPLTAALVTDLLKGNLYVNVHTFANPGGEIRGQIVLAGGEGRDAVLSGAAVVPPVATSGMGTASMTITDEGLVFRVSCDGLSGPLTGAHIHEAPTGVNGPIVRDMLSEFVNLTGDGVWKPTDVSPLTGTRLAALARDVDYLDLHTGASPGGEIRGQSDATSTLDVGPEPRPAHGLELEPNSNPVRSAGTLRFHMPHAGRVRLAIYDVAGALVTTLLDGPTGEGWHDVTLDAHRWRDGVYFARLRVDGAGEVATKLLVMR